MCLRPPAPRSGGVLPPPQQPAPAAALPGADALPGVAVARHDADALRALLLDPRFAAAVARRRARAHPERGPRQAWPAPEAHEGWMSKITQKALSYRVAQAAARRLWTAADARDRAFLQARLAPGAAAWLQVVPAAEATVTN